MAGSHTPGAQAQRCAISHMMRQGHGGKDMKKAITRVRKGNVICSAAKNPDGAPIWRLCKDGSITLGVKAVGNATVQ